ncbi:MAG: 2-dehydropantoate 2-reductase [Synergistaceae bacterium]|jgi:2-dehydropantoate 2-reductase|nr:2-dehydropantoate 2-reductase [Synergistaceae bacterium]
MKIVIVGLGGVGGVVGGRLAAGLADERDHEVVFWCRGKTLDAVRAGGLHLLSGNDRTTLCSALATCDVGEVGAADCLIFATKSHQLEAAARDVAPLASENTIAIPLLNGVSAVSTLEKHLAKSDVLGGCIYVSAHVESPGTVRQVGSVQRVLFGKKGISEAENRTRYASVEQVLKKSGIQIALTERIDVEMWSKFIFLSPFAGVTTLLGCSIDEVLGGTKSFETVTRLIGEIEAVGRAKGVDLPENIADITVEKARAFAPGTRTSMQIDREKGRPTELESLIGYVCREGRALGVPVPAYDGLCDSLKNLPDMR